MREINKQILDTEAAATVVSDAFKLQHMDGYALQAIYSVSSPGVKTFADADVNTTNDTITEASHGYKTGLKVALTNSGGALPTGLSATDYYVIRVDDNTIKLASSQANALAGTAVNITAASGGGTHTLTPASLAGGTIKLQASALPSPGSSASSTDWIDVASSSQSISASGSYLWNVADAKYLWVRVHATMTAGQIDFNAYVNGKGAQ